MYRTYDGSSYSLAEANADGSHRRTLWGPNFAHPDEIRFVSSSNWIWTAWADGGDLRAAALAGLASATTLATTSKILTVVAVSDDGDTIAYELRTEVAPEAFTADLYLAHVHDKSTRLLRKLRGPVISCLAYGAFDAGAHRLLAVGCGPGMALGLVLVNVLDGTIISEDDGFLEWPGHFAFSNDIATVWLIEAAASENDVIRYDVATRARSVLYRAQTWQQPVARTGLNLFGVLPSPDGTDLVFVGMTPDRQMEVYVLPSGGGDVTKIFEGDSSTGLESWTPDGTRVAVSGVSYRIRLIDPRTKDVTPLRTEAGFIQFLAWVVA